MRDMGTHFSTMGAFGIDGEEATYLSKRPYINDRGALVVSVPAGLKTNDQGEQIRTYRERVIATPGNFNVNATLRKDEWIQIDMELMESFRQRLQIVEDLRAANLIHSVGGLGVLVSEWENASEITDAAIDMHGEPPGSGREDRQEFGLNGVPVPLIHKEFQIGERVLQASRQRGSSLDVTTGIEASRACARTIEDMVVNGVSSKLGAVNSDGNTYSINGLTTFPNRATYTSLSDWSAAGTTQETILTEILEMVQDMEENQRRFGPFALYIPADASFQFYQDFKAESDKTLMTRVLEDPRIDSVKVLDVLAAGNVLLIQLDKMSLDLAEGAAESNIQWASGSGWTNFFQTFAAIAPRLKTDYDGRTGIMHGTEGS